MMRVAFTILGQPVSKANRRKVVKFRNRPALIKSDEALQYERDAILQIPDGAKVMFDTPVRVTLRIFYESERPDLDESIVLDVMQAKFTGTAKRRELVRRGVYLNDRLVREKHVFHGIDRTNPRTEVEVETL